MTSSWVTVVVAIAAAVATGLLATVIRISYERGAELRTRMLDAADEFLEKTVSALHVARNTAGDIQYARKGGQPLVDSEGVMVPKIRELVDGAGDPVDEAQARLARVHLLFDDRSPAGVVATEISVRLRNIALAIRAMPHSKPTATGPSEQYFRNFDRVVEAQLEFSRAALQRLRTPGGAAGGASWAWLSSRSGGTSSSRPGGSFAVESPSSRRSSASASRKTTPAKCR
jgi:hypothetical protein